jgi:hypothetical protein
MHRLLALALAIALLLPALPGQADEALLGEGRRLYLEGLRADGSPLEGWRPGGERLRGRDMACVQCHRRSGMGTVEGVVVVPPITGPVLFAPGQPPAGHTPRRAAGMALQDHSFRTRPAYDAPRLARALREGMGAGDVPLDPLMPRYTLSERELAALQAWLESLGTGPVPGVGSTTLHLATVITPDADARQRDAMRDVLQRCIAGRSPPPGRGRRPWELEEWALSGPPQGWRNQLEARMRQQPAFALVSGIGRDWTPVHEFCEAEGVPCLFPNTDLPGPNPRASVYLWPGMALEGAVLARHLMEQERLPTRIIQVFDPSDMGREGAAALRGALVSQPVTVFDRTFRGPLDEAAWRSLLPPVDAGDVLVLWLGDADLERLLRSHKAPPTAAGVFVSGTLAGLERAPDARKVPPPWRAGLRVIYPFDAPEARLSRMVFNLGSWMSAQGLSLARDTERTQGNTHAACEITARALYTLGERYSRDYLLELVEDSYAGATASAFPRFTLGPGQRYGSKGAHLMRIEKDGSLAVDGDWIVP